MEVIEKQRKGQWIYNKLRPGEEESKEMFSKWGINGYKAYIADKLWNIIDEEFDKIMGEKIE